MADEYSIKTIGAMSIMIQSKTHYFNYSRFYTSVFRTRRDYQNVLKLSEVEPPKFLNIRERKIGFWPGSFITYHQENVEVTNKTLPISTYIYFIYICKWDNVLVSKLIYFTEVKFENSKCLNHLYRNHVWNDVDVCNFRCTLPIWIW